MPDPRTPDEVWSAVKAEMIREGVPDDLLASRTMSRVARIAALAGYRLACEEWAERLAETAVRGA